MGHKINHATRTEHMKTSVRAAVEVMFQRRRQCLAAGQVLINRDGTHNPRRFATGRLVGHLEVILQSYKSSCQVLVNAVLGQVPVSDSTSPVTALSDNES
jgi:hypothetical protein